MNDTLYRRNDNLIEWTWLSQSSNGEFINDGTVTFTLYSGYTLSSTTGARTAGTAVTGATTITMSYVTGSNGTYQGKLPSTVDLDLSLAYTLEINATANSHIARRAIPVTVTDRIT